MEVIVCECVRLPQFILDTIFYACPADDETVEAKKGETTSAKTILRRAENKRVKNKKEISFHNKNTNRIHAFLRNVTSDKGHIVSI